MLKQSGNTVDECVFFFFFLAQIQAGEWPQALVLKPQIQRIAQEKMYCESCAIKMQFVVLFFLKSESQSCASRLQFQSTSPKHISMATQPNCISLCLYQYTNVAIYIFFTIQN